MRVVCAVMIEGQAVFDAGAADEAVAALRNGGLVVYPTDTLYALGADPFNSAAMDRLFAAKRRPAGQPVSVVVASVDAAKELAVVSPRATDTFPEFLRRVAAKKLLSMPEAIGKITAAPAAKFGLAKRGWVREGYLADLVVFRAFEVRTVVVNGIVAVRDGSATGARSGRPLLHRPT